MATKKVKETEVKSVDLLSALRKEIKNNGAEGTKYVPTYDSSIKMLDYRNAKIEGGDTLTGFNGGKILTVIGKSGSGKTTMAVTTALSAVKGIDNAMVIHMDYENASTRSRVASLANNLGMEESEFDAKYEYLNTGIYAETLYTLIKATSKMKLELYDDIKIHVKDDANGDPIHVMPPTVFVVDSLASVVPESISGEEELSGQMSATSIARTNNAIIKRITQPMAKANIMLIIVNHITTKVEINPYARTTKELNYLGQDESCPGGTSAIYLADTLLKLTPGAKLEEDKDFGVKGFMVNGMYLKTRSNEAGRPFELVFNQSIGFDDFYTNFNYIKKAKLLRGNGKAFYLDFDPDTKFTQKNVRDLYESDVEWAKMFDAYVEELYSEFITTSDQFHDGTEEEVEITLDECIDEEQDIWMGSDGNKYFGSGEPV